MLKILWAHIYKKAGSRLIWLTGGIAFLIPALDFKNEADVARICSTNLLWGLQIKVFLTWKLAIFNGKTCTALSQKVEINA